MLLKISFSLILSLGLLFSQLSHSQVPLSQETKPDHDLQTYNQSPTLFDHEIGNDEIVRYTDQTRPFVHYFKDLASDTDCIANNTTFNLIAEAIKFKVNTLLVYNILRIELEMETFSESKPQGIIENSVEMIKKLNAAAIVSHNSQLQTYKLETNLCRKDRRLLAELNLHNQEYTELLDKVHNEALRLIDEINSIINDSITHHI